MRECAQQTLAMQEKRTAAELTSDFQLRMALERVFILLGEATGRLEKEFREKHPQVPWHKVIGMRNRIVHGYDTISLETVWHAAKESLPELLQGLDTALVEFGGPIEVD